MGWESGGEVWSRVTQLESTVAIFSALGERSIQICTVISAIDTPTKYVGVSLSPRLPLAFLSPYQDPFNAFKKQ